MKRWVPILWLLLLLCLTIIAGLSRPVKAEGPDIDVDHWLHAGLSRELSSMSPTGFWNGFGLVVVLTADDGYGTIFDGQANEQGANNRWSAVFDSLGVGYTIGLKQGFVEAGPDNGALTVAETQTIANLGSIEMTTTGRHWYLGGLAAEADTSVISFIVVRSWVDSTYSSGLPLVYIQDGSFTNYHILGKLIEHEYISGRGSFENGGLDKSFGVAGYKRMDPHRYLRWDEPSNLYAVAFDLGETAPGVFGTHDDYPNGLMNQANVEARLDSLLARSAAGGYYPVVLLVHDNPTGEQLTWMVEHLRSRGDVWITTMSEMAAVYRDKHVPVDPPAWALYAKLEGITSDDSMFWGPEPEPAPGCIASGDTLTYVFSNEATNAQATTGVDSAYTDGLYFAMLDPDNASTVAPNGSVRSDFVDLPLAAGNGEEQVLLTFNVDELDGRTIAEARLFYNITSQAGDVSGNEEDFFCVVGVTDRNIVPNIRSNDISFDNYIDAVDSTWASAGVDWSTYSWYTDFGDYVYPFNNPTPSSYKSDLVTDYIQYVVDNDLYAATFLFTGNYQNGTRRTFGLYTHTYIPSTRPFLRVTVCD